MSGAAPPRAPPFAYGVFEGSREHVYALKRARWARALEDWLEGGRPAHLVVEPTPPPWSAVHGFLPAGGAP